MKGKLLFKKLLVKTAVIVSGWHWRVTARGVENFSADGGVLLLPNHVTYVDSIILSLASPRPIRFVSDEQFFRVPVLGWLLRLFDSIPISPRRAKDGIARAAASLSAGEVVCLFPEGKLTRDGQPDKLQGGFQLIARRAADAHVIVARMDGLWGSVFSYYGGRLFTKLPRQWLRRVTVTFSAPLTVSEATPARVAEELRALEVKPDYFTAA